MFATIMNKFRVPSIPNFDSIEWTKVNSITERWGEFNEMKTTTCYSIGSWRQSMVHRWEEKLENFPTSDKTTYEWEFCGHIVSLSVSKYITRMKWIDPIVGKVIFSRVKGMSEMKDILDQWRKESYEIPLFSNVYELQWQEDGCVHSIKLCRGTKLPIYHRNRIWKQQQRSYWMHTKTKGDQTVTIDWQEEILDFKDDWVCDRRIKSPNMDSNFHYVSEGHLTDWSIEQGDICEIFSSTKEGKITSYTKYVGKKSTRMMWDEEDRMWYFHDFVKGTMVRMYCPIENEHHKPKIENGRLHVTDGIVKWGMKFSDLPQGVQESFLTIA
jgi:hypothetical protein